MGVWVPRPAAAPASRLSAADHPRNESKETCNARRGIRDPCVPSNPPNFVAGVNTVEKCEEVSLR